jgi:hypothetical protein
MTDLSIKRIEDAELVGFMPFCRIVLTVAGLAKEPRLLQLCQSPCVAKKRDKRHDEMCIALVQCFCNSIHSSLELIDQGIVILA